VSAVPDPRTEAQVLEQQRRRLSQKLDSIARLCEASVQPHAFYGELLKQLLESLAATAGVVWARTQQGNLQQQFAIGLKDVGLEAEEVKKAHEELLRHYAAQPQPMHLPPRARVGPQEDGKPAAGNLTDYQLLIVPIKHNDQLGGIIEVWIAANRPTSAVPGFTQFMSLMADLAARYQRNQMIGQLTGQQALWTQIEGFARQIHRSLNPTEVGFEVANGARRLVECDRVSVAIRTGRKTQIEAVSGVDVVERRSNQVRLMRRLSDAVLTWGEKLVFQGIKDDSLPPKVYAALDAFLGECPSQLLVIQPLHEEPKNEQEKDKNKDKPRPKARAALVMECFEAPPEPAQTIGRLEVVSRHATTALLNAVEYRRVPMRFLWMPLAKVQEGLGGKARAWTVFAVVLLSLLGASMVFLPYPLKMEASGHLYPAVRRNVCPPEEGVLLRFNVDEGEQLLEHRPLALMFDSKVRTKMETLQAEADSAGTEAREAEVQAQKPETSATEKPTLLARAQIKRAEQTTKQQELQALITRIGARRDRPGDFTIPAPQFTPEEARRVRRKEWTVLTGNFKEKLGLMVRPSEPIIRLGAKEGPWELELKIPQKNIGQILMAFDRLPEGEDELDVDFVLQSRTTRLFKGKLHRDRIAGEALPQKDDNDESEPVVLAYVRISGKGIDPDDRLPRSLLLSDTGVKAKIRCGDEAMGYSLFYGVWEFFFEKVVFFF
jgi:hypothetical protein